MVPVNIGVGRSLPAERKVRMNQFSIYCLIFKYTSQLSIKPKCRINVGRFLSSLSVFLRVCTYKYLYVFLSNCIGRSLCISLSLYRTISMYFCLIVHDDLSCISILLCAHDDLNGFLSMTFSLLGPKSRRGCSVSQSLVALAMF